MTHAPIPTSAPLEHLAGELHGLAFDFQEPSRSTIRSDALIAKVEDLAARIRAVVRGPAGAR